MKSLRQDLEGALKPPRTKTNRIMQYPRTYSFKVMMTLNKLKT